MTSGQKSWAFPNTTDPQVVVISSSGMQTLCMAVFSVLAAILRSLYGEMSTVLTTLCGLVPSLGIYGNLDATTWIRFGWVTLPVLSTAHKVIHTGILSCCSYFESIIHFYWMLQRENLVKSSHPLRRLH